MVAVADLLHGTASHLTPSCCHAGVTLGTPETSRLEDRPLLSPSKDCRFGTNSLLGVSLAIILLAAAQTVSAADPFQVAPDTIQLQGNFARVQVAVTRSAADGSVNDRSDDLTHAVTYESSDPSVFTVDKAGVLLAVGDGAATLKVTAADASKEIPVEVGGVANPPVVRYRAEVGPILYKAGCTQGGCHASQFGKGGFKMSLFGFDAAFDREAVVRDRLGRRVDYLDPARSLFVQKSIMKVAHGGGRRIANGSVDHQMLVAWVKNGAPAPNKEAATPTAIKVTPPRRVAGPGATQQLRVAATYSDGSTRDVTAWAKFDSMDEGLLSVSRLGLVTAVGKGQAPVMVRFEDYAQTVTFVVPYSDSVELAGWQSNNFIDELAANKFRELGIEPSPLCDDATFVRRAFLDCIGTLPSVDETVAFIKSQEPNKREQLIDRLLGLTGDPNLDTYNEPYSAFWTLKWSDLIRNTSTKLGEQGMWALHNWIRDSFRANKPFDQFVRELVTGKGSIYSNGPANYFRINQNAADLTESTSQLFLGIRMECAKCHHHPFEKYSQGDYYGFAAFFSRVGTKNSEEFGLFGRETVVMVRPSGESRHPRTGKNMPPTPLDGEPTDHPLDRRLALAEWLTAPGNEYFAKSVVNRYVSYLLGRGLVEQVDDMRSTNPPTNVALMDALAKDFVEHHFDLKHLVRTIMMSRLYQLDSQPTESNASDDRFYSHFKVKRLSAETLLDTIDQVTGVQTKFRNLPPGTRAIELPDAEYPNYFLNTFAKPRRASVCECERPQDESLSQALHTLNGDIVATKIADKNGLLATLIADEKESPDEIIEQLYLTALSRYPTDEEKASNTAFLAESNNPQEFYEDLLWVLVNSKQFLFVR
ncbi:MAG: S-layer related protein (Precursor) [Planctomycetaceae bacterium]|nr:S-layer related protein (Precursor) [Planctomycetaceae bacterium]